MQSRIERYRISLFKWNHIISNKQRVKKRKYINKKYH